jgi:hypothetical protein
MWTYPKKCLFSKLISPSFYHLPFIELQHPSLGVELPLALGHYSPQNF